MGATSNYVHVDLLNNDINKGTWILDNAEELEEKYDLELRRTNYNEYYTDFEFLKGSKILEELPKIKFIYQNELDDKYNGTVVTVNTKLTPKLHYEDNILINKKAKDYPKNTVDLTINNKEDFVLQLSNKYESGYNWYLENASEIEENPYIELLCTNSYPGSYDFTFRAKDVPKNVLLPTIVFSEKKYSDSETANRIYNVNLNLKSEYAINFENDQAEKLTQSVFLYKNETFVVSLNVTSTENKWFLEKDKVDKDIEPLNLGEDGEGQFLAYENNEETDVIGTYKFKFYVKESIASNYATSLKFIEAKSRSDKVKATAEVSMKTKKERTEEELENLPYRENSAGSHLRLITVESNTLLKLSSSSNPRDRIILSNNEEIKRSDFIDYIGRNCDSNCVQAIPGCSGWCTDIFRIWEVSEGDNLPQLKYYRPGFKDSDFAITLEAETTSESPACLNGYKCCSDPNAKIYYTDKDGYWGVEHGEWCVINKKRGTKKVSTCTCERSKRNTKINDDAICCSYNAEVLYTEDFVQWGYEKEEWCLIPDSCEFETYPICDESTKVVYTDNEEWGVEFGEWCVKV